MIKKSKTFAHCIPIFPLRAAFCFHKMNKNVGFIRLHGERSGQTKDAEHEREETGMAEEREQSRFPDGFRILQGRQEYITYIDHSSIRIWPSDVAGHFDAHTHSAVEIIMPHRGISVYHLQDVVYRVHPGEILILPSGCVHELTERSKTLRYLILFEPNPLLSLRDMPSVSEMMKQPIYLNDHSDLHKAVQELLMEMINCYFRKELMWNTRCYSYLLQVYAMLGENYLRSAAPDQQMSRSNIDPAIMNSAMTFINEHYMEDIPLERVALFAGFSKCYFSRVFKQFSGVTFSEYLIRKRLNIALDLLINTRRPIREICDVSGFGSMATFNRIFRRYKNCTPSQFRSIYGTMRLPETDGVSP